VEPVQTRPGARSGPRNAGDRDAEPEGLAGFVAAVGYLADITDGAGHLRRDRLATSYDAIALHERALSERFLEGIASLLRVRLWGIAERSRVSERTPTFALRVGDEAPRQTAKRFAEQGIFVWDGDYYAREIMNGLGLSGSGGAVRIGFCHYHSQDDVDRVIEALAALP
jgi:selenocysteine lyase/cysteine desulfurase